MYNPIGVDNPLWFGNPLLVLPTSQEVLGQRRDTFLIVSVGAANQLQRYAKQCQDSAHHSIFLEDNIATVFLAAEDSSKSFFE
jgi:hypothetical protein